MDESDNAGRYESLLLALGIALGALSDPLVQRRLEDSLHEKRLHRGYIERLVAVLADVLANSKD